MESFERKGFHVIRIFIAALIITLTAACSSEVGSEAWCEDLKEKDKGEWTLDETAEYAKSYIFLR